MSLAVEKDMDDFITYYNDLMQRVILGKISFEEAGVLMTNKRKELDELAQKSGSEKK